MVTEETFPVTKTNVEVIDSLTLLPFIKFKHRPNVGLNMGYNKAFLKYF